MLEFSPAKCEITLFDLAEWEEKFQLRGQSINQSIL